MIGRKLGLTAEKHIEAGRQLTRVRDELLRLAAQLSSAYPRSVRSAGKMKTALLRAAEQLSEVKSLGDGLSHDEHSSWCMHWYYPRGWEEYGEMPHSCPCGKRSERPVGGERRKP